MKDRTTPNPRAHLGAVFQLIGAALCWSLAGLLIKSVPWSPLAVAGSRGLIAAAFLAVTNGRLRFHFSSAQCWAAVAYAGCTVLFCAATKLTTAANAILLQYTAPVWVALFSAWFVHEPATRRDWTAIAAVLCGMALFFAGGLEMANALGNGLAILSGVAFAAMSLAMRRQKDGSPVESIILGNLLGGLICLPWIVRSPAMPAGGWTALVLLGVVQLGVSYWLYARAIKHVTALEAVLVPVVEPLLNPVWVFLSLGERPAPLALLGGAIVLGAVTWRALPPKRGNAKA